MNVIFNEGGVTAPKGFLAAGIHCGVKKHKKDLALIYSKVPATVAGVFTTNKIMAAPVILSKKNIENHVAQAVVVNSGNANACTGETGMIDASEMAAVTAQCLGCKADDVIVASTGVIGVKMPMDIVKQGIKDCSLVLREDGGSDAAEAIMTTDTFKKEITVKFDVDGKAVTIGGMTKGSGMIHPNMATMLCFITTDAAITPDALDKSLRSAVIKSFNMISVDGDTSTNDTAVVMANGLAGNTLIDIGSESYKVFNKALEYVCIELAKMMARDGEGATKFMEVEVKNAASHTDAVKAAREVTRSNLVKTALFGEDANWGRIICAVGYAGIDLDPNLIDIIISSRAGEILLAQNGMGINFSEEKAKEILSEKDIKITVDLKYGSESATAWGCDFSYDYVKINGSYRT